MIACGSQNPPRPPNASKQFDRKLNFSPRNRKRKAFLSFVVSPFFLVPPRRSYTVKILLPALNQTNFYVLNPFFVSTLFDSDRWAYLCVKLSGEVFTFSKNKIKMKGASKRRTMRSEYGNTKNCAINSHPIYNFFFLLTFANTLLDPGAENVGDGVESLTSIKRSVC